MNLSSGSENETSSQGEITPSDCSYGDFISSRLVAAQACSMLPELLEIYSENVLAKLLRVAQEALENNVSR